MLALSFSTRIRRPSWLGCVWKPGRLGHGGLIRHRFYKLISEKKGGKGYGLGITSLSCSSPLTTLYSPTMKLILALAQINTCLGDVQANLEKHLSLAAEAQAGGADLLIFPSYP